MIRNKYQQDCKNFKKLIKTQHYIDEYSSKFDELYCLSYFLYNMLPLVSDREKKTYIEFIKRDMISALNLVYILNFESAKKDYRSVIESVLRYVGKTVGDNIKEKNSTLPKSIEKSIRFLNSHKIGKFTHSIQDIFKSTRLEYCLEELSKYYRNFSGVIHANSEEKDIASNLHMLKKYSSEEINTFLRDLIQLTAYLIIFVYYATLLDGKNMLDQQDFYFLGKKIKNITSIDWLMVIVSNYADIV